MTAFPWHAELYGLPSDGDVARASTAWPDGRSVLLLAFDADGAVLVRTGADGRSDLPELAPARTEPRTLEDVARALEALHLGLCDVTPIAIRDPAEGPAVLVLRLRVPPSTPLRTDREWEWAPLPPEDWSPELRGLVEAQRDSLAPMADIAVNEVEEQDRYRARYEWIHRRLVRPLFGSAASEQLRAQVFELLGERGPVIDFACGDDLTVALWCEAHAARGADAAPSETGRWAVANDVAFVSTEATRRSEWPGLFFSTHDLRHLPLRRRFASGLLKNTLHHLPNRHEQQRLLVRLLEHHVERLVVVEIRDPAETGFRAQAWNAYYRFILGDQGEVHLGARAFVDVVRATGKLVRHGEIDTDRGTYMWAVLDGREGAHR